MSSSQRVTAYGRSPAPGLAIVTATAFAIGALLGVAVQGALDRATIATTAASQRVAGVAEHNMGDAANAAQHPSEEARADRTAARPFKGVADNNMSDAAYAAQHDTRTTSFKGVADHNMSDAARRATYSDPD